MESDIPDSSIVGVMYEKGGLETFKQEGYMLSG